MKISWLDVILVLAGLIIIYQLVVKIFGGSWETESFIIAMMFLGLGVIWKLSFEMIKLNNKFDRHIMWHEFKGK